MKLVVGVKFAHQCKVVYYDPKELPVKRGDGVIVETEQGKTFGVISFGPAEVEDEKVRGELKPLLRVATEDDFNQLKLNRKNEKDALRICKSRVEAHGLAMKLLVAEYAFDRSKLTVYYTSENYVDFRALVKDLAGIFKTRIELRQVGVRDETRLIGGLGLCGRELCCAEWITDFSPVTIKEAKEQNLSLNSSKVSGACGRLMCCIRNEADTYAYLNSCLPALKSEVKTSDGLTGTVKAVNVLKQTVTVLLNADGDEREEKEYPVAELTFKPGKRNRHSEGEEEKKEEKREGKREEKKDAGREEKQEAKKES